MTRPAELKGECALGAGFEGENLILGFPRWDDESASKLNRTCSPLLRAVPRPAIRSKARSAASGLEKHMSRCGIRRAGPSRRTK